MTRWLKVSVLAAALCSLLAGTAFAQDAHNLELNLFTAGSLFSRSNFEFGPPQSATPIPSSFVMNSGIRGGVRFNVNNTGHWGEEFFYSFEPDRAAYVRNTTPILTLEDLRLGIHNFGANGLYYFDGNPAARTRVFVSFGLGGTVFKPSAQTLDIVRDPARGNLPGFGQSQSLTFNYGVGFKQHFSSKVGMRIDLRHFITENPSFSLPRSSTDPNAVVFPANGAIHNLEASGGLVFYLGR